jgi:hypothetical protein
LDEDDDDLGALDELFEDDDASQRALPHIQTLLVAALFAQSVAALPNVVLHSCVVSH